jgi:hypothetical protein
MRGRSLALISLAALAGCTSSGEMRLFPVDGPMASLSPPPVIVMQAANPESTSGTLTFRLPDRTRCEGTWSAVAPRAVSQTRGLNLNLRRPGVEMSNTAEIEARVNRGEIYAICTDSTRIEGSFVTGSGTNSGTGSATDTNGNTYKLLF